jgi:hypothetical protein
MIIPPTYKPRPTHIFIDLDRKSFETDEQLEEALQGTLLKISQSIKVTQYPEDNTTTGADNTTVIWSGNGYHIHVPIHWKMAIEDMPGFANFAVNQDLASRFVRWAEYELSNGLKDKSHNPSINSCLFRVPGTVNRKAKENGLDPIVTVRKIGDWYINGAYSENNNDDGEKYRSVGEVTPQFLLKFQNMLVQEVIDDRVDKMQRRMKLARAAQSYNSTNTIMNNKWASWIEPILRNGVSDHRKDLMFWVLAPYLITVKGLGYEQASIILKEWLVKCSVIRKLEPSWSYFEYRIRYCLDFVEDKERWPIPLDTFKEHYPELV